MTFAFRSNSDPLAPHSSCVGLVAAWSRVVGGIVLLAAGCAGDEQLTRNTPPLAPVANLASPAAPTTPPGNTALSAPRGGQQPPAVSGPAPVLSQAAPIPPTAFGPYPGIQPPLRIAPALDPGSRYPVAPVAFLQEDLQRLPLISGELPPPFTAPPPVAEWIPRVNPAFPAPPPPAADAGQFHIPFQGAPQDLGAPHGQGPARPQTPLVTISVRETPLHTVLTLIAQQQGVSIVANSDLKTPVTVTLQPTTLENALDAVMAISGCTWARVNGVIYVTPIAKEAPENFLVQAREMRVFNLSYLAATDAEKVVTGLLSPVGKVFTRQVDSKDKRKAQEQLVIEDLPPYVNRVVNYLAQADHPPRQVMVEARVLQVKLQADSRHGVNFDALAQVAGADITFKTQAFATGVGPAGIFTVDGTDFNTLIDCLATTTDSKTLAAPKLLMINGQESKIQIGRRLGYFVTTTTQTSTLQDVQFLEVGVLLTVTPNITADGQIVMKVHPKVSAGDINPTTTLPEEETTEVDTSIMVPDGHGVIIGGLLQEQDVEHQTKVRFLGDIWLLGRLFQRRSVERERTEVVVALLPRIVPQGNCPIPPEEVELQRISAPLVTPTLQSAPRPWEPKLPDAVHNPIWPQR